MRSYDSVISYDGGDSYAKDYNVRSSPSVKSYSCAWSCDSCLISFGGGGHLYAKITHFFFFLVPFLLFLHCLLLLLFLLRFLLLNITFNICTYIGYLVKAQSSPLQHHALQFFLSYLTCKTTQYTLFTLARRIGPAPFPSMASPQASHAHSNSGWM